MWLYQEFITKPHIINHSKTNHDSSNHNKINHDKTIWFLGKSGERFLQSNGYWFFSWVTPNFNSFIQGIIHGIHTLKFCLKHNMVCSNFEFCLKHNMVCSTVEFCLKHNMVCSNFEFCLKHNTVCSTVEFCLKHNMVSSNFEFCLKHNMVCSTVEFCLKHNMVFSNFEFCLKHNMVCSTFEFCLKHNMVCLTFESYLKHNMIMIPYISIFANLTLVNFTPIYIYIYIYISCTHPLNILQIELGYRVDFCHWKIRSLLWRRLYNRYPSTVPALVQVIDWFHQARNHDFNQWWQR